MKYRTAKVIRRINGVVLGGGLVLAMLQPMHATVITNAGTFSVGSAGGDNNNVVTVTNNVAPIIQMTAGAVLIGSGNGGTAGGNDNTVILSNATLTASVTSYLGAGSSNNSLTLLAGTMWNNNAGLVVGANAATGNILTVNGGVISNVGSLFISGAGVSNQLVVVNGGLVSSVGNLNLGLTPGANFNSLIVTNGGRLIVTGDILIGTQFGNLAGGNNNTVILSNSVLTEGGFSHGTTIGSSSSSNAVTLLADTVLNTLTQPLTVGLNTATGNVLTISGGLGTIGSDLTIGSGTGSIGNSLIVTNGGRLVAPLIIIGSGAGSSNNTFAVAGGGANSTLVTNTGELRVGYLGGAFNRLTVANGTLVNSGALGIGAGSGASSNNQVVINAGGVITNVVGLNVGTVANANFNSLIVTSGGSFFMRSGAVQVGLNAHGNTVLLSNSVLTSSSAATVGNAGSTNTLTLFADAVWNNANMGLTIGTGAATGNTMIVNGGLFTNVGGVVIGATAGSRSNQLIVSNGGVVGGVTISGLFFGLVVGQNTGADYNSLIVTNGGRLIQTGGDFLIGAGFFGNGGGNNTVILSNSEISTVGAVATGANIGKGSSNNTVILLADTVWRDAGRQLQIAAGADAGVSNGLTLNNAIATNFTTVTIGKGAGNINFGNFLIVTNGSRFSATSIVVGMNGSSNNSLILAGGSTSGAFVTNAGALTIGDAGSGFNLLTITNARLFTGAATIGNGSSNNLASLAANAIWNLNGNIVTIGQNAATGNVLTLNGGLLTNINTFLVGSGTGANGNSAFITNGGLLVATTVQAGSGSAANNSVLVTAGGLLQANNLTIGIGTGNTISNRNATYQFTAAPTAITAGGNVTLTDGTISFRATGAANVTNNQINNIRFAGANTFTLNNASNTAAPASQTYTFDAIGSNPSNYVNLVMVNGATAYGNANGANLTIGASGSMLVSNTTATISGLFTNLGTLRIVANSTAIFNADVFYGATASAFIDNSSTLSVSTKILTNTGTLTLNGGSLVLKDLHNEGHLIATGGGFISNALLNAAGAYIDVVSGVLTGTPDLINFGVVSNNATFQIGSTGNGPVTNSGLLVLNNANFLSGQITNTGMIRGDGTVSGMVLNTGTVAGTNGTLRLLNVAAGTGAYRAEAGGTLAFQGGGSISSLWNTGGTVRVASTVTNTGSLFINAGTLVVAGASYVNAGALHNLSSGVITANAARVTVGDVFTNDGTLSFQHSVGTFTSAVVNRGAWITDPSTNIFLSTHTVTTNGYISASTGDVFRFHDGLQNQSTNKFLWQTLNVTPGTNTVGGGTLFEFVGTSVTQTQVFSHPGLSLTGGFTGPLPGSNGVQQVTSFAAVAGFNANFALGQLWVTNTTLVLTQAVAGAGALFVNDLFLLDAGNTRLVISDNMRLYFVNSNGWDMANITLLGNGEIHQLDTLGVVVIPEPNVLLLCLAGFATMWLARQRHRWRGIRR